MIFQRYNRVDYSALAVVEAVPPVGNVLAEERYNTKYIGQKEVQ